MNTLRLGILFSTSGPYGSIGRDCRDGAALAIAHLGEEGAALFVVEPVWADPAGRAELYIAMAGDMMRAQGCRHIVGAVTSQSRKDIIPIAEKLDGQLWYVCPYEGFEANENVIYTGACPNQHLFPLFETLLPCFGRRVYLAGANYVWGWEMNRLAREIVVGSGGEIVGERCLPIEEADVELLIADVAAKRPDFILSNLIGPSSHAFLRAMRVLADRDPTFSPARTPVASCDLTECELADIGPGAADGQLSAASYFDSLATPESLAFRRRVAESFGPGRRVSSFFATAYATVRLLAAAVARCGGDDPRRVREALPAGPSPSVLGPLTFDPATNHFSLPFHLGRIAGDGFEIVQSRAPVAADPYVVHRMPPSARAKPGLRIVS